jgi:hypothetical protein
MIKIWRALLPMSESDFDGDYDGYYLSNMSEHTECMSVKTMSCMEIRKMYRNYEKNILDKLETDSSDIDSDPPCETAEL